MGLQRRFKPVVLGALLAVSLAACKDPQPTRGALHVSISGLPTGAGADIRVTGPSDFFQQVTSATTLDDLEPGEYILRIDTVTHSGNRYGVAAVRDTLHVVAGATQTASVAYGLASGSVDMTVTGVPAGANADIKLTATGFSVTVTASGVVGGLPPGKVYIHADTFITTLGDRVGTAKVLDSVIVPLSLTPVSASVTYAVVSATLALTVSGMPPTLPNLQQPIAVTGPNGYSLKTSGSTTVRGLNAGTYTVAASNANGVCPAIYRTTSGTQTLDIGAGQTGSPAVSYTEGTANPADLNLRIEKVQLIQVTQDDIGLVPMVQNREALVRVFGFANQCNSAVPKVRITLGTGEQFVIDAPEGAVRYKTDVGALTSTWNYPIPKELVVANMTVVAEIDHEGTVAETDNSDNRLPAAGTQAVPTKLVPPTGLRIVKISNGGLTGDIPTSTVMDLSKRLHPVSAYDIDVRPTPFTSTVGAVTAGGGNWEQLLTDFNGLRAAAGESPNRYHLGLVRVAYSAGTAGIAFIQGKAALTWDDLLTASEVAAHELGHSFGRFHAPSGICNEQPDLVDLSYPKTGLYSGGRIGTWGYDQLAQQLKSPENFNDIMGYCRSVWISDYMYVGMLNYLSDPNRGPTLPIIKPSSSPVPALLVWGRIVNGVPVLEPAFEIETTIEPVRSGPTRLTALDDGGNEIFALSFATQRIAHSTSEGFAFAIPLTLLNGRTLASLRLSANGRSATNATSARVDGDPELAISAAGPGRVRIRWDAARFPALLVRDRQTGDILSFARGGDVTIAAPRDELDVAWSNRVRSAKRGVRVPR